MTVVTLTGKGQITIPEEIRNRLKLGTGDPIDFQLTPQGQMLPKPRTLYFDEVFGRLNNPDQKSSRRPRWMRPPDH